MLSEKEKVKLDEYITFVNETPDGKRKVRKNAFGETLEAYQDDLGSPIYDSDKVYLLSIKTETEIKHFLVLFENAQELLDEYEQELVTSRLLKYEDGKSFKKRMEEMFGE